MRMNYLRPFSKEEGSKTTLAKRLMVFIMRFKIYYNFLQQGSKLNKCWDYT